MAAPVLSKAEALYHFFAWFGGEDVYEDSFVPHDASLPRITYQLVSGDYGAVVPFAASIWMRTGSLQILSRMADDMAEQIGLGGKQLPCVGGHIHLYCGSPWAQILNDDADAGVVRVYLNFTARFNTVPVGGLIL